jgi:hypothetical protein
MPPSISNRPLEDSTMHRTLAAARALVPALLTAFSTLLASPLGLEPLSAQEAASTRAAGRPTLLALPDRFPVGDASSMLLRTPERDVVVLRTSDLSVDALVMALSLLRRIEEREPAPAAGQIIPITGYSVLARPTDAVRRRLEEELLSLERAPAAMLGDLGSGRWIRLRR